MKRSYLAILWFLPFLASCNGSTSGNVPQSAPSGSLTSSHISSESRQPPGGSSDLLYIGNIGNNSITVYKHDAQGNTAPLYVIAGPNTEINSPGQLSEDAQGNLYVANGNHLQTSQNPAVLVFAHGANGNVAPIRNLSGPLTGIHDVWAMTVDQTTGEIWT